MSYRDELLPLSWAMTWRLLASNVVILLVLAMLMVAFGSPHSGGRTAALLSFYSALYLAAECLLAWPFVLRRTLPPQIFSLDPRGFVLRYWPAVLFGVAADLSSAVPVMLLHLAGAPGQGFAAVIAVLIRLFVVLPLLIRFVARRPATA